MQLNIAGCQERHQRWPLM